MTDEFAFFKDLFEGELDVDHKDHPSNGMLLSYAYGTLEPEMETAIVPHIATCAQCSSEYFELQGSQQVLEDLLTEISPNPLELEDRQPTDQTLEKVIAPITQGPFWIRLWNFIWYTPPVRRHAFAFAGVSALLIVLNWGTNVILDSQPQLTATSEDLGWWSLWIVFAWFLLFGLHIVRSFKRL